MMAHTSRTRDFHFDLPDEWVDRTMIAWSARPIPGQAVTPNILVAYDALRDGETLAAYVNRQLKQLMVKAKRFQLDLRQDTLLDGRSAVEVMFQWDSGTAVLKQRQIYTLLTDGRAMTLVNTAAAHDFEKAEPLFKALRESFAWNELE